MSKTDPSEAPTIKDYEGRWDEYLAGFIVSAPFILVVVGGLAAMYFGYVDFGNITVTGTINVRWFAYGIGALLGATWLLALMKLFGIKPIVWLANVADSYRRNN